MKNILILFAILGIISGCSSDDDGDIVEFAPGDVIVGIKSGTGIKETFDFINQFDHTVDNIDRLSYTSDLPSDSLQYVLDFLNGKSYTNDGINWFVTGYLHYQTNQITISPRLFEMHKIENQNDWLKSMKELKLHEKHNAKINSGVINFHVPEGEEKKWISIFKNFKIIEWAELNHINEIELLKE